MIIAVNFPTYVIGKKKPEKNQGLKRVLYQLSYEATHYPKRLCISCSPKLETQILEKIKTIEFEVPVELYC